MSAFQTPPAQNKTNNNAAGASVVVDSGVGWVAPKQNNLLVAFIWNNNSAIPTATGWSTGPNDLFNASAQNATILYKIADGTESSITFTAAAATSIAVLVLEYVGAFTLVASVKDVQANDGSNSSTTVTSRGTGNTATLAAAGELALAFVATAGAISAESWSSYTQRWTSNHIHVADFVTAGTGAQGNTLSWTTAVRAGGCVAVFKAATLVTSSDSAAATDSPSQVASSGAADSAAAADAAALIKLGSPFTTPDSGSNGKDLTFAAPPTQVPAATGFGSCLYNSPAYLSSLGFSGTSTFTFEFRFKLNSLPGGTAQIAGLWDATSSNEGRNWHVYVDNTGTVRAQVLKSTAVSLTLSGGVIATGGWHSLAVSYDGTTGYMFIDGVLTDSGAMGAGGVFAPNTAVRTWLFQIADPTANAADVYLDEVRISSTARYTSGYTPATTPFANDGSTTALWHLDSVSQPAPGATDSAAASESVGLISATVTHADSAAVTEAGTIAATVTNPDSGTAADSPKQVGIGAADSAGGSEGGTISPGAADSAAATDSAGSVAAQVSGSDSAGASEGGSLALSGPGDSAAASDGGEQVQPVVTSADSAAATDAVKQLGVSGVGDSAAVAEAGTVAAQATSADSAAASDAVGSAGVSGSGDSASGSDQPSRIGTSGADSAAVVDAGSVAAQLSSADSAAASEAGSLKLSGAGDSAAAAEGQSVAAQVTGADSAAASEGGSIGLASADSAAAADAPKQLAPTTGDSAAATDGGQAISAQVTGADSGAVSEAVAQIGVGVRWRTQDTSGNGKDFTFVGHPVVTPAASGFGSCVYASPCWLAGTPLSGTSPFTIEFRFKLNSIPGSGQADLAGQWDTTTTPEGRNWHAYVDSTGTIRAQVFKASGTALTLSGGVVSTGAWHTLAISYDGTTAYLLVDGVLTDSGAVGASGVFASNPAVLTYLFQSQDPTRNPADVYLDELRVSSTARYTAGYTPAVAPFAADGSTTLLLHLDSVLQPALGATDSATATDGGELAIPSIQSADAAAAADAATLITIGAGMKPPLGGGLGLGLCDMGGYIFKQGGYPWSSVFPYNTVVGTGDYTGVMTNVDVVVFWKDLQPLFQGQDIDLSQVPTITYISGQGEVANGVAVGINAARVLADAATFGWGVHFRILGGWWTPPWLWDLLVTDRNGTSATGKGVYMVDSNGKHFPPFWTAQPFDPANPHAGYTGAYSDLMVPLAARLDGNPNVRAVTFSATLTQNTAEPLIRDFNDQAELVSSWWFGLGESVLGAGDDTDTPAVKNLIDAHMRAWRWTPMSFSMGPNRRAAVQFLIPDLQSHINSATVNSSGGHFTAAIDGCLVGFDPEAIPAGTFLKWTGSATSATLVDGSGNPVLATDTKRRVAGVFYNNATVGSINVTSGYWVDLVVAQTLADWTTANYGLKFLPGNTSFQADDYWLQNNQHINWLMSHASGRFWLQGVVTGNLQNEVQQLSWSTDGFQTLDVISTLNGSLRISYAGQLSSAFTLSSTSASALAAAINADIASGPLTILKAEGMVASASGTTKVNFTWPAPPVERADDLIVPSSITFGLHQVRIAVTHYEDTAVKVTDAARRAGAAWLEFHPGIGSTTQPCAAPGELAGNSTSLPSWPTVSPADSAAATDAVGGVAPTTGDSGSAADVPALVRVSGTGDSAAAGGGSEQVGLSAADTAGAVEGQSVAAVASSADQASASDAASRIGLGSSDQAAAVDAGQITAQPRDADIATAADVAVSVGTSAVEQAAAADAVAKASLSGVGDQGTANEGAGMAVSGAGDTSAATDAGASVGVAGPGDTAAAVDAGSVAAVVAGADQAAAQDQAKQVGVSGTGDAATVVEGQSVATQVTSADQGAVAEAVAGIGVSGAGDVAAVVEGQSVVAQVSGADAAAADDEAAGIKLSGADVAGVTDAGSVTAALQDSDQAAALDAGVTVGLSGSQDSGLAVDVASSVGLGAGDSAATQETVLAVALAAVDGALVTDLALSVGLRAADVALLSDAVLLINAQVTSADSASVTEGWFLTVHLSDADAAVVIEGVRLVGPQVGDVAVAIDNVLFVLALSQILDVALTVPTVVVALPEGSGKVAALPEGRWSIEMPSGARDVELVDPRVTARG